jgi:hypothetical protein
MISDEQNKEIEDWDPDEAREKMSAKGVRIPIKFTRDVIEEPNMQMETTEPPEKIITITKKPSIINLGKKNKNALF